MSARLRLTSTRTDGRPCWLVPEYPRSTTSDLPIGLVAGTGSPCDDLSLPWGGKEVIVGRCTRSDGQHGSKLVSRSRRGCCTFVLHVLHRGQLICLTLP